MAGKKPPSDLARFSGIGLQMVAIIGIFVFIGYKIDEGRGENVKPWFTLAFSVFGVIIGMVYLIRSIYRDSK